MKGYLSTVAAAATLLLLNQSATAQSMSSPEVSYDCAGIPNGTTRVTDCGCGQPGSSSYACRRCGDNTSCLDCAGVPFGGRVPVGPIGGVPSSDPCTLVCPSGTELYPPENTCLTPDNICRKLEANLLRVGAVLYHPTQEPTVNTTSAIVKVGVGGFGTFAGVNAASSCIGSAMESCLQEAIGGTREEKLQYLLTARRQSGNNADADRCVTNIIRSWGAKHFATSTQDLFGAPTTVQVAFAFVNRSTEQGCGPADPTLVALATRLRCDVLNVNVVEFSSPVSLLWSNDVNIDEVISFAAFPLDGKNGEKKPFQWRASGMTPLVVYDSTGLGEIKDATQLFGNHTFGKEWKNGYDALASLDIDKSGWLEGEELNAVALWFDFNQDGMSQKGEVKRLADVGVFAIGAKGDRVDEKTKNIFASKGFKRRVAGKEIVGGSVDWFAGFAEGQVPAQSSSSSESTPSSTTGPAGGAQVAAAQDAAKIDPRTTVSGIWEWRMTDDKMLLPEQQPGGLLAFTQEGGSLRGQSVSTVAFRPNAYKIDEQVTSVALTGSFGNGDVTFEVKGSKGTPASSTAKLSADGIKLTGSTVEVIPVKGGAAKVTYAWEARRLVRTN